MDIMGFQPYQHTPWFHLRPDPRDKHTRPLWVSGYIGSYSDHSLPHIHLYLNVNQRAKKSSYSYKGTIV